MAEGTILTPPAPVSTVPAGPGAGTPPAPEPTPPADPTPVPKPGEPNPAPPAPAPAPAPAPEPKPAAGEPKPPAGPPEKYDLKMPEGVVLDQALMDQATPIFRDLGLTNEAAQKLVDLQTSAAKQAAEKAAADQQANYLAQVKRWADETKADPDFKGTEAQFGERMAVAVKGVKAFASEKLQELLDDTGLGNHPEVVRLFYKLGLTVKEPTLIGGGREGQPSKADARSLYPNSNMNP
jgi:hypothetical protein